MRSHTSPLRSKGHAELLGWSRRTGQRSGTPSDSPDSVADEFAYGVSQAVAQDPGVSLAGLHQSAYVRVRASHVSFYKAQGFGDIQEIGLQEFVTP